MASVLSTSVVCSLRGANVYNDLEKNITFLLLKNLAEAKDDSDTKLMIVESYKN